MKWSLQTLKSKLRAPVSVLVAMVKAWAIVVCAGMLVRAYWYAFQLGWHMFH